MIATRESITEFIKSKVASDLSGITIPDMKFALRSSMQAPEFPNCVNLYFFDDLNIGRQYNPHWRILGASIELLVQIDPTNPLTGERQALEVMHLINQFMAQQSIQKLDYSVVPPVSMKSSIEWRDSYPVEWTASPSPDERYIHKSSFITFRYFEEPVIA